jgi:hypothetical protein
MSSHAPAPQLRGDGRGRAPVQTGHLEAACVIALVAAIAVLATAAVSARDEGPAAPRWRPGTVPCRPNPMHNVHSPTRVEILARCATVSGVVEGNLPNALVDGDEKLLVRPDPEYRGYLRPANDGLLVLRIIPTDLPDVHVPKVGEHATFYGTWVRNKSGLRVEMHPAWHVEVTPGRGEPPRSDPSQRGTLAVTLDMPRSVTIGDSVSIALAVQSLEGGARRAASEVDLFLVFTTGAPARDGARGGARRGHGEVRERQVRWEFSRTNALGHAQVEVVAFQTPGPYRIEVWAHRGEQTGAAHMSFRVRRR